MIASLKEHQEVLYELLLEFNRICEKHKIPYTLFAGTALGAVRHKGFIPWDDDLDVAMLRKGYELFLQVARYEVQQDKYFIQSEYSEHWPLHFSKLRKNNTTCLEKYHPRDSKTHQGIYIDIFPIDNASDNAILRMLQFLCSKIVIAKNLSKRGYETDNVIKRLFIFLCKFIPAQPLIRCILMKEKTNVKYVHSFLGGSSSYKKSVYPKEWFTELETISFMSSKFPISTHFNELLTTLYGNYMIIPSEKDKACKVHAILVDTKRSYTEYEHYRDGIKFKEYTRSIR